MSALPDRAEVQQLFALFSHVFDNGDLAGLGLVFTEDAVIELVGPGREFAGLDAIAGLVTALGRESPDHHTLDTVLLPGDPGADGAARARSRYLAVLPDGSVHNGDYYDDLRLTEGGWRIARRISVPRYPLGGPFTPPKGLLDAWRVDKGR